jgi:hypothetical protein
LDIAARKAHPDIPTGRRSIFCGRNAMKKRTAPIPFTGKKVVFHFPIKAFRELQKSRQSSVFLSYIVSFPSFGRGFDSHRSLEIQNQFRYSLTFYSLRNKQAVTHSRLAADLESRFQSQINRPYIGGKAIHQVETGARREREM